MSEDEVVQFLHEHPGFFQQHAELFTQLLLPDPHHGRAVSLVERQAVMLRERVRALDTRLAELLRIGRDNDALARQLVDWTRALLAEPDRGRMASTATEALKRVFGVPLAELRIWGVAPEGPAAGVAAWAARLSAPLCGTDLDLDAIDGLAAAWSNARSAALIPLRSREGEPPFGIIAMGSSDPSRFDATLGTAVLARIGELAGAALAPAAPVAGA
jgi:uncharacterized protein YigA (DUF484 family)